VGEGWRSLLGSGSLRESIVIEHLTSRPSVVLHTRKRQHRIGGPPDHDDRAGHHNGRAPEHDRHRRPTSFTYDPYGNLTSKAETGSTQTATRPVASREVLEHAACVERRPNDLPSGVFVHPGVP
jgi:YD repeat-containing protein